MTAVSTICPADRSPLEPLSENTVSEVRIVVEQAQKGAPTWAGTPFDTRADRVEELARRILEKRDEITKLMSKETGRSETECLMSEVASLMDLVKGAIQTARKALADEPIKLSWLDFPKKKVVVEAVPRGVVGIIAPWNYPLANFYKSLFPAILAGNAVVLKPSEHTPRTGAWLADQASDLFPKGIIGIVQGGGTVGQALLESDIDAIVFTGSVPTGRSVASIAGEKLIPCSVELGGKDAAIVLADCDLDRTVIGIAQWGMHNAGQNCAGIERVIVEEAIADTFVERLGQVVRKLRVAPREGPSDLGPLQNEGQLALVQEHVADALDKGAGLVAGGAPTGPGFGFEPTVLDRCTKEMKILTKETFGPVVAVQRAKDAEEAVAMANDSDFGLNGSVWTQNLSRGAALARRLEVGVALVNNHAFTGILPQAPWTGVKDTGPGIAQSRHAYHTFVRRRTIVLDRSSKPDPWWIPATEELRDLGEALAERGLGKGSLLKLGGLVGRRIKAIRTFASSSE